MTDVSPPQLARSAAAPPPLAKELTDFLVEMSVAMHRRSMYPGGHPSLATAEQRVMKRVTPLLVGTPVLAVGVARDQLIIDGVATDPRHHLLRGLAERLHSHRLAGFRFQQGLTVEEVTAFLERLARDPEERTREPLSVPGSNASPWPHIGVFRQSYERLELADETEEGFNPRSMPRATQLWLELAQAAMSVGGDDDGSGGTGWGGGSGGGGGGGSGGGFGGGSQRGMVGDGDVGAPGAASDGSVSQRSGLRASGGVAGGGVLGLFSLLGASATPGIDGGGGNGSGGGVGGGSGGSSGSGGGGGSGIGGGSGAGVGPGVGGTSGGAAMGGGEGGRGGGGSGGGVGGETAAAILASHPPAVDTDPTAVAKAINTRRREAGYEQAVVGYLLQIAEELRTADNPETAVLRTRVSGLVRSLSPDAVHRLLEMGGNLAQRRTFLTDASAGMATDAVLTLTVAAAQVSQQAISKPLLRLLVKLATHAKRGAPAARSAADIAFREHVREMVDNWTLPDPTSVEYGRVLDRLTGPAGEHNHLPSITQTCEPERTIEISLELRNAAASLWDAIALMIARGAIVTLLDMIENTPADNPLPGVIRKRIATPHNFARLLEVPTVEGARIEDFARRVGPAGIDVLLDALAGSQSRATRRKLLGALARLGEGIGPAIVARLPEAPWYTQRNLLILLGGLAQWPPDFSPLPFATHADARVRREALRLMLKRPATRNAAVAAAVGDTDHQIIRLGLDASQKECPVAAVPRLVQTVSDRALPPDLQVLAVRALACSGAPAALPCLIDLTITRTRWLRRERLAQKSSTVLAALAALNRHWSSNAQVARVIARAERSPDPDIRAAVMRSAA